MHHLLGMLRQINLNPRIKGVVCAELGTFAAVAVVIEV